jgi:hypothetical protein
MSNLAQAEGLTSTALFETYKRDEILAEDTYNGRRIDISGRISAFKEAVVGAPIVLLDAGSPSEFVRCQFPTKAKDEVAGLKIGDQVGFSCIIKYRMGDIIHASACRLN